MSFWTLEVIHGFSCNLRSHLFILFRVHDDVQHVMKGFGKINQTFETLVVVVVVDLCPLLVSGRFITGIPHVVVVYIVCNLVHV